MKELNILKLNTTKKFTKQRFLKYVKKLEENKMIYIKKNAVTFENNDRVLHRRNSPAYILKNVYRYGPEKYVDLIEYYFNEGKEI